MMRRFFAAAAGAALSLSGCVSSESTGSFRAHYNSPEEKIEAEKALARSKVGPVSQVKAMWESGVMTAQNSMDNGSPLVGLLGRLYFYGDEIGYARSCKGTITVYAYEILPDGKTKKMEGWEIDPAAMQKLGRKDMLGTRYTLFLPWSTYRPDIARVQLQVRFVPETGGVPIFSTPTAVSLLQDAPPLISSNVVPIAGTSRK